MLRRRREVWRDREPAGRRKVAWILDCREGVKRYAAVDAPGPAPR